MKKDFFHIIITIFLCAQYGCGGLQKNKWTSFSIQKGQHHCEQRKAVLTNDEELKFSLKFDSTCVYTIDSSDQADVNKLIGIADDALHPSKNSARLGWRYNIIEQKIELLTYTHNNNQFDFTHLCFVECGTEYKCSIKLQEKYVFTVGNISKEVTRTTKKKNGHCLLFFYFGGNQLAPHDMQVMLKFES